MTPQVVCTSSRRPGSQRPHHRKAKSPRGGPRPTPSSLEGQHSGPSQRAPPPLLTSVEPTSGAPPPARPSGGQSPPWGPTAPLLPPGTLFGSEPVVRARPRAAATTIHQCRAGRHGPHTPASELGRRQSASSRHPTPPHILPGLHGPLQTVSDAYSGPRRRSTDLCVRSRRHLGHATSDCF
ncbi:hypothetical protein NDU88_004685 [Pleurodeles waltl]|uniref:Uncharacterized protein n=1 Tax=Pleurodeles waltl TaxID=8319 RepID=A0AAV7W964_PLEWA|nr:hypothetical protein NDU88_004685 [Pleurodeles waltl]